MEFLISRKIAAASAALALFVASSPAAPTNEYALKSVFLYNFCRFIDWPESAFSSPAEPLIIGIVGDDPFGTLLTEAIAGETYHNRSIQIAYYRGGDIRRCHLLFVSRSEMPRLNQILPAATGKPVVTVGETEEFLSSGGMIALIADRGRVRLRVNQTALRAARIDVSSKLLRVADLAR